MTPTARQARLVLFLLVNQAGCGALPLESTEPVVAPPIAEAIEPETIWPPTMKSLVGAAASERPDAGPVSSPDAGRPHCHGIETDPGDGTSPGDDGPARWIDGGCA
jgi:hypothetical protein